MNLSARARLAQRRPHRLGRPGDRHQDGPGDVGVARARAHPAERIAQPRARAAAIRGTTSTSTRSTPAPPATCCCPRATPGRCTTSTCTPARFSWRLGGAHSSFKLGPGTRFYWQHDAEFQPGGLISVFDNGSDPPKEKQSRGLLLRARLRQPHGHARQAVHQPAPDAARLEPGQHARACPAATGCWATAGCRTSPSSTPPARCCSTARSARTCRTSGPTCRRGAASPRARRRSRRSPPAPAALTVEASWNGATERRLLARARGRLAELARAGRDRARAAAFRRRIPRPARAPTSRCRRSTPPARSSAPRRRSRLSARAHGLEPWLQRGAPCAVARGSDARVRVRSFAPRRGGRGARRARRVEK